MSESSLNAVVDMAKNGRIENLFSTPLFSYLFKNVDSLNAELRDLILERERTTPSAVKSNMGGWQSQIDFLNWDASAVQTLRLYLGTAVEIERKKAAHPCGSQPQDPVRSSCLACGQPPSALQHLPCTSDVDLVGCILRIH